MPFLEHAESIPADGVIGTKDLSALLAAILAELLMGTSGLGYMFRVAAGRLAMDRAFGTSLIATITAVVCFGLVMVAERRVEARWK